MFSVIDTATPQRNLDLSIPFGQGYRTNYVKLGGDQVGRYVSPHYHAIVDRSRAIGYRVGHYWVPSDAADPVNAADYFVDQLRGWTSRDFVVLDNESLDGSRLYSDGQAARWVERVKARLGIPGRQVFVYYGLADARARTHDAVLATGANFIIAAYSYAAFTFETPSNIPRERVVGHQTGGVVFGGVATDVNTFTDNAFDYGVTMEEQMRQFIAANRKPADAATWDQMCGSLMFRFNSWRGWTSQPVRDISSAFRASKGSTIISTDFMRAPVGAFHFFDIGGPGNGHVMQDARGGGLVCLSTGYALSESLGSAIGFQSVPGYVAAKGARYIGWSRDYAGGTINVAGLAGGGGHIIEEDDFMTDMNEFLNTQAFDGGPTISELFRDMSVVYHGVFNGGPSMEDAGNPIQRSLAQINSKVSALSAGGIDVDVDAFATAVATKVVAGVSLPNGVDPTVFAKAVASELAARLQA